MPVATVEASSQCVARSLCLRPVAWVTCVNVSLRLHVLQDSGDTFGVDGPPSLRASGREVQADLPVLHAPAALRIHLLLH